MLLAQVSEETMKPIVNSISIIQNELTFMNTWINNLSSESADVVNDMLRPLYPFGEEIGELRMSVAGWKENVSYLYDKHKEEIDRDMKISESMQNIETCTEEQLTHYLILFAVVELKMSVKDAGKFGNRIMEKEGLDNSEHEEDFYLWYYDTYISK